MLSIMRKHAQSWIIKLALFSVAIVFVFWGVGSFRSDRASRVAEVNGEPISVTEYQQTFRQTMDKIRSSVGQQFDEKALNTPEFKGKIVDSLIEKRLILEMGKKMGFSVTPEELSRSIQQMPFFQENGKFSLYKYRKILQMNRMTPEVFEAEQTTNLLQERVKGFLNDFIKVDPEEVRNFYSYLNDEVNCHFLLFKKEDYKKQITLTSEQLNAFFSKNQSRYRTPVQVRVAYLDMNPKDFEANVVIHEKEVQEYYQQNQQKFIDSKTNKPFPVDQVLDKIRSVLKEEKTRELAFRKAEEVYDQVLSKGNLKAFGQGAKVLIKETEWLTSGQIGSGIGAVKEFNQKAFSLKKGELTPVLDLGPQWGFAILQVTDRRESQPMTLAQAESRVKEDLTEEKASQMALSEAEAALKSLRPGKDLQQWAKEKNKKWEETGFFSRVKNRPPWADTPEIQEVLFSIGPSNPVPGKPFKLGSDYGIVAFKESRRASLEDLKKDQERFSQALQQQKQYDMFGQWSRTLRENAQVTINRDLI
ncbi:MAG: SurA N-terminal domain-containing protein [Deltaproteobacteria bacterium]|nr:SurA N-terminal domain-containing protein [Deltaproteobacteria bacterium]